MCCGLAMSLKLLQYCVVYVTNNRAQPNIPTYSYYESWVLMGSVCWIFNDITICIQHIAYLLGFLAHIQKSNFVISSFKITNQLPRYLLGGKPNYLPTTSAFYLTLYTIHSISVIPIFICQILYSTFKGNASQKRDKNDKEVTAEIKYLTRLVSARVREDGTVG